jgi:hypothetical protein
MKTYKVTFTETIQAESEDEAYGLLLEYLDSCVRFDDVSPFNFEEQESKS